MTSDEGAAVIDVPGAPSVPDILVRVEHVAKAFGPTQALQGRVVRAARGRGPRPRRRERLGQEHARQDPERRPRARRGPDRGGRRPRSAAQPRAPPRTHGIVTVFQEVLVAEARSVLDNVWLGADGHLADAGSRPARSGACAQGRSGGAARPAGRPRHARRGAVAERPAGLLHRARAAAPAAHPDPRRGDLGARRGHARPAVRADRPARPPRASGVIFITHRMDEIERDRRSHHGHALGRDRRHASAAGPGRRASSSA